MISIKVLIKEVFIMDSLIMLKILKVFDYLSIGNEYWIGIELNLLCLCIKF